MRASTEEFMERWWRDYAVPNLSGNTRDCYARIWSGTFGAGSEAIGCGM